MPRIIKALICSNNKCVKEAWELLLLRVCRWFPKVKMEQVSVNLRIQVMAL